MIFLNRKRTITDTEKPIVKDPSKYWYIEKYVYGELIETIEVALDSGTKFTALDSGYVDDYFYGWSRSSTSKTSSYNTTTSYKNTSSSVKNYLDSNNTLKIYAVYTYNTKTVTSINVTRSSSIGAITPETTYKLIAKVSQADVLQFSGYVTRNGVKSSISFKVDNTSYNSKGSTVEVVAFKNDEIIVFMPYALTQTDTVTSTITITSTVPLYRFDNVTTRRVTSHT